MIRPKSFFNMTQEEKISHYLELKKAGAEVTPIFNMSGELVRIADAKKEPRPKILSFYSR